MMTPQKEILFNFLNTYIPPLALAAGIVVLIFWLLFFYEKYTKKELKILKLLKDYALFLGFILTTIAATISFIYSDFLGQEPCGLCWFQRIFLYSQVVLYLVAYIKNDIKVFAYTLWLSIIGAVLAIYHEYLQLGYSELMPCPVASSTVDCTKPLFLSYGFVTFPFTSFVLFAFLIVLALIAIKNKA